MKIRLNLSDEFINKALRPDREYKPRWCKKHQCEDLCWTFNSFYPRTVTPAELTAHILSGKAWTVHAFQGKWRNGKVWASSQVLALDLDKCPKSAAEIARDPRIADHAYLVCPSPSSTVQQPKTRVIFILSEPITDLKHWQFYQRAFFAHFADLEPDPACKSPAQFFYGATVLGAILLGNHITLETVETVSKPLAEAEARRAAEREQMRKQNPPRPLDPTSSRAERIAQYRLNKALDELAAARDGDRHGLLLKKAFYLFSMVKGGWPLTDSDVTQGLHTAMQANGAAAKYGDQEITRCIDDSRQAAPVIPLEVFEKKKHSKSKGSAGAYTTKPPRIIRPASLPAYSADLTVNLPYVTGIDPERLRGRKTIALKSATGTGKTEFVSRLIKTLPESATVLALTHRVSLVEGNARRLATLHYKDEFSAAAPRIASTVDSLHKQEGRSFDVLFIDEASQVLRHLTSAGTLKERTIPIYEIFKQLVHTAGIVILADANLNDDVLAFFRTLRSDVYAVENTYQPHRAGTVFLDSRYAAIQEAMNQVEAGTVLIPCATQRDARLIHKLLQKRYPDKRGRIITARNSETTETKHFVAEINDRLTELDWLVFTSSMGTGVDIQTPVHATVGIFGQPIAPSDAMQMLGRARNAKQRFAYAPDCAGGGETDPDKLFSYALLAADETSRYGIAAPDPHTRGLARLKAIFDAQENHANARYLDTLAAYLTADGSAPQLETRTVSSAIKADWKAIGEGEKDLIKSLALTIEAVSNADLDDKRSKGEEITDKLHAGNLRYKIEDASGMSISPDLYDRLKTAENRRRLARFASLIDDESALKALDQDEANKRQPLHRRRNWQAACRLFMHILKTAFGVESVEGLKNVLVNMPADELTAKVEFIGRMHTHDLKALLGYREGHDAKTDNAIGLFRWVCARFSLKFERKRARIGEQLIYVYSLDTQELDTLLEIARARIAHQRDGKVKACSQNVNIRENDESGTKAKPAEKPPVQPTAHKPLIVNIAPRVRGNPFAAGWKPAGAAQ